MKNPFDRDFFKFVLGFLLIVLAGIGITIFIGSLGSRGSSQAQVESLHR